MIIGQGAFINLSYDPFFGGGKVVGFLQNLPFPARSSEEDWLNIIDDIDHIVGLANPKDLWFRLTILVILPESI